MCSGFSSSLLIVWYCKVTWFSFGSFCCRTRAGFLCLVSSCGSVLVRGPRGLPGTFLNLQRKVFGHFLCVFCVRRVWAIQLIHLSFLMVIIYLGAPCVFTFVSRRNLFFFSFLWAATTATTVPSNNFTFCNFKFWVETWQWILCLDVFVGKWKLSQCRCGLAKFNCSIVFL